MLLSETSGSTRVPLTIVVAAPGVTEPLRCDGEAIVVGRHGALIRTSVSLLVETKIEVHVIWTNRRSLAKVVYVDPGQPRICVIWLDKPENIWGVSLPANDWYEDQQ